MSMLGGDPQIKMESHHCCETVHEILMMIHCHYCCTGVKCKAGTPEGEGGGQEGKAGRERRGPSAPHCRCPTEQQPQLWEKW